MNKWFLSLVVIICALSPVIRANPALPRKPETGTLRYSEAWVGGGEVPAFQNFYEWTRQYVAASRPGFGKAAPASLLADGVQLARQRRAALGELIKFNPAQAIAVSVPASIRRLLPPEVSTELETRVSGIGDFSVVASLGATPTTPSSVQRFVTLGNRRFRAYVYGRRLGQTTKYGIPLHGIALDDELALHEGAVRELDTNEGAPLTSGGGQAAASPQTNTATSSVFGQIGETTYQFGSRQQLLDIEARLEAAEAGIGPRPTQTASAIISSNPQPTAPLGALATTSTWTKGTKSVLVIRVDFPDLPGPPEGFTDSYVHDFTDAQIAPFYRRSSYAQTDLTNTVTTAVYRLPKTSTSYASNIYQLHADAEAAAAADYTISNYDLLCVFSAYLGTGAAGQAEVGGQKSWIYGYYDFRVVAHEFGHNYGVWHGNLWQVTDGDPISPSGYNAEYGDDFDVMGANFANDTRVDFNPWFKSQLSWFADIQVQTVSTTGIYRINSFDNAGATGVLALKIVKDSGHNYWIGARRSFTGNDSMQNGAYIVWGYNYNSGSDLLDMTTPGSSDQDAALALGTSFVDSAAGVAIKPVAEGGVSPNQYLDVQVTMPGTPGRLETEALTVQALSGATHSVVTDANLSGGAGTQLSATAAGQYVTYTIPVSSAGTYKVKVGVKTGPKKGIFQLSIDGVNQGKARDEYSATAGYEFINLGAVTFSSGGNKAFTFLVTGKNANSSSYSLTFDYIELIQSTTLFEAEGLPVQAKSAAVYGVSSDANTSGGAFGLLQGRAVGDFVTYTVPVLAADTYNVKVRIKAAATRGIFQLAVDGVNQGTVQDGYSSIVGYEVRDLGPITFTSAGNKAFRFRITGRNPSSSNYSFGLDYVDLIQSITHLEAEGLTVQSKSAAVYGTASDANASGGALAYLKATAPGDFVTYTVPVAQAGTYTVKVGVKTTNNKGIFQLAIGGVDQGLAQDEYSSAISYQTRTLGTVTFTSGGNKTFEFRVVGRNPSSSSYGLSFDYIELAP